MYTTTMLHEHAAARRCSPVHLGSTPRRRRRHDGVAIALGEGELLSGKLDQDTLGHDGPQVDLLLPFPFGKEHARHALPLGPQVGVGRKNEPAA